ncbi:MAG: hypothetical protein KAQ64_03445 [Candidatus Pacebacteria bacterium]|nr:hypothetical protein [Candidatus Paceibacterota bacterium]
MKKEALSIMIVKTLLVVIIFTGMGIIIIGGVYIIGSYHNAGVDKKITKPVDQETENYYNVLEKKCAGNSCCVSSLKTMRANNYKEADRNGECPEGFYMDMMKCITSYQWCVPMEEIEWRNCEQDSDCVETQADCCSCRNGGKQIGINKKYLKNWENTLTEKCQDIGCIALFNCKKGEVVCKDNKCEFQKETDNNDQSDISDWQTYRSKKGGFELSAPIKWDFNERISAVAGDVDLFLFFNKEATTSINEYDYVQLNIRIKQNKSNLSMEDFYDGKKNADLFRNARNGYNEIVVGGKDAVRFREKDDIGADVVVIPLQDKFIEIDSANSNIEMFNKILLTFKFTELVDVSNWLTYRNEGLGFEMKYPEDWFVYERSDQKRVYIQTTEGHVSKATMQSDLKRIWIGYSFDELSEQNEDYLKKYPGIKKYSIKNGEILMNVYEYEDIDMGEMMIFAYWTKDNNNYLARSGSEVGQKNAKEQVTILRQILPTFKFIEK